MTGSISTTAGKPADRQDRLADRAAGGGSGHRATRTMIDTLFDAGTFTELEALSSRAITGHGEVDGRAVCVYGLVAADAPTRADLDKVVRLVELALTTGRPVVGITAAADGPPDDGLSGVAALGALLRTTVRASGVIPQISVTLGPVIGDLVFPPAMVDFVVMVKSGSLALSDPATIATMTPDEPAPDGVGGADFHLRRSGLVHHVADDPQDAADVVRDLLAHLPANNRSIAPRLTVVHSPDENSPTDDDLELDTVIPAAPDLPYDVRDVIERLVDGGAFLELQADRAANIVTGFGHLDGHSVGVVANQPKHLAGYLDIAAAEKAARFVRTCDAFNLPVVTLVDVPGFLTSAGEEANGLIRCSAKLVHAYGEASVPMITVVLRKAYGAAYLAMGSRAIGADTALAWPTARIAPAAASVAVRRAAEARGPESGTPGPDVESQLWKLQAEYEREHLNPDAAARLGQLDAVVAPSTTRAHVATALRLLRTKMVMPAARKHGNIPL